MADVEVTQPPGYSEGHVSFRREADGTLALGDVFVCMNPMTTPPGLAEPPALCTSDPERTRESPPIVVDLDPVAVLFGHGSPLADTERYVDFVSAVSRR